MQDEYLTYNSGKDEWVRCGRCKHKMFKIAKEYKQKGSTPSVGIEIKCKSCKAINYWEW